MPRVILLLAHMPDSKIMNTMKRQSLLSSWLSGAKKPRVASPDSNDEETGSRVTDSQIIVSEETDELGSCESASTSNESTTKSFDGIETER